MAEVVPMIWWLMRCISFAMRWQLNLMRRLLRMLRTLHLLGLLDMFIDTWKSSRTRWGCHINRILLLWLHLDALYLLHYHIRESKLNDFLILCNSCYLVIIVVAREEILSWLALQRNGVFLKILIFQVFPFFINVLLVEVVLFWWNERWLYLFLGKVIPRKVT